MMSDPTLLSPLAWFTAAQQALHEHVAQPLLFQLGLASWIEDAYIACGWFLVGVLQLLAMGLLIRPLERRWPLEPLADRGAVRTDVVFTLIHRLGIVRLVLFLLLDPLWLGLRSWFGIQGLHGIELDQLWPGVTDRPWVAFALYLLLFDAVEYLIHRGQHAFGPWWQLHAVHHSQRQMTMWSDDRNHLLDDVLREGVLAAVAVVVGIPPGQFLAVIAATRLIESLSHANTRLDLPRPLRAWLVGPRFHRVHHAIAFDPAVPAPARARAAHGRNFAVLFPLWDVLGRTADFRQTPQPTGIGDQRAGRDYGRGFWALQWRALARLAGRA